MTDNETDRDERQGGGFGAVLRLHVELWLVVVFMALAFGAGIVITALYEEPAEPVVGVGQTGGFVAPPLTDDQINQGLPSGHPDLGAATGATGASGATGATGTTGAGGDTGSGQGNDGGK